MYFCVHSLRRLRRLRVSDATDARMNRVDEGATPAQNSVYPTLWNLPCAIHRPILCRLCARLGRNFCVHSLRRLRRLRVSDATDARMNRVDEGATPAQNSVYPTLWNLPCAIHRPILCRLCARLGRNFCVHSLRRLRRLRVSDATDARMNRVDEGATTAQNFGITRLQRNSRASFIVRMLCRAALSSGYLRPK